MKKIIYIIAVLVIASVQAKEGVLTKIVDGDTLHFKTDDKINRCKIAYIDTPESIYNNKLKKDVQICKNVSFEAMLDAGKSATNNAKKLLQIGKTYNYSINSKDTNKQICEVSLGNGITFSEKMLLDGYAVLWREFEEKQDKQNFNSVLIYAKNKNNGLWGDSSKKGEAIKCLYKIRNQNNKISDYNYDSK